MLRFKLTDFSLFIFLVTAGLFISHLGYKRRVSRVVVVLQIFDRELFYLHGKPVEVKMLNEIIMTPIPDVSDQIVEIPASEVPESEISVEISSEPLYCVCQEPWDFNDRKFMIHCDHCGDWFHGL